MRQQPSCLHMDQHVRQVHTESASHQLDFIFSLGLLKVIAPPTMLTQPNCIGHFWRSSVASAVGFVFYKTDLCNMVDNGGFAKPTKPHHPQPEYIIPLCSPPPPFQSTQIRHPSLTPPHVTASLPPKPPPPQIQKFTKKPKLRNPQLKLMQFFFYSYYYYYFISTNVNHSTH